MTSGPRRTPSWYPAASADPSVALHVHTADRRTCVHGCRDSSTSLCMACARGGDAFSTRAAAVRTAQNRPGNRLRLSHDRTRHCRDEVAGRRRSILGCRLPPVAILELNRLVLIACWAGRCGRVAGRSSPARRTVHSRQALGRAWQTPQHRSAGLMHHVRRRRAGSVSSKTLSLRQTRR